LPDGDSLVGIRAIYSHGLLEDSDEAELSDEDERPREEEDAEDGLEEESLDGLEEDSEEDELPAAGGANTACCPASAPSVIVSVVLLAAAFA
jgi:hypothetical protein